MSSPRSGRHAFHGPYGPGARAIAVHGPLVVQGHRCTVILTAEQYGAFIQTGELKKQWFGKGQSIPVKDSLAQAKKTHTKKIKNQTTNKQQHNKKQKLKQNSKHKQTTNTTTNKNTQQTKHKPRHMHIP